GAIRALLAGGGVRRLLERQGSHDDSGSATDHAPNKGAVRQDLANTLVRLEEYSEAEKLLVGASDLLQTDEDDYAEDIGIIYNSLANLMQHLGQYERAEDYYRRALDLHRTSLGNDHPFVATDLHNLALMLASVGRNKEAIEMQEDALARSRVLFPDGHEQIATSLVALAGLYRYDDERSPEAPGMIKEAISLQSRLYGENSHDVAQSQHELGRILHAQRDFEGAREAYEHAITLYTALYGEQHNNVAVSLQALARTLGSLERYDEARMIFDRVLEIQYALFGEAHEEPAITLLNLGAMHRQAGEYDAAEEAILRALSVFDAAGLGRTGFAASSYENLGAIYRATDRLEESADALRQGLDVRIEADGPNARNTLGASYALAGTLIDIEDFDEAEALLQHILDDPDGVVNKRIRIVIQRRYADLLFASNRFEECTKVLEACYRAHMESGSNEDAGEALTELVRVSERRQELDPTPANEEAAMQWRQLLEERD
ncbi:MAG: tetratricopeptide repeat protein, partial [Phycisphaerales bacterium JB050]